MEDTKLSDEDRDQKRKYEENIARIGKGLEDQWAHWSTLTPEQQEETEGVCHADIEFNIYRWPKRGNLTNFLEWWFQDGPAGILLFDPQEIRQAEQTLRDTKVSMNQEAREADRPLPFPEEASAP